MLVDTDGNADGTVQEIELIKAFPAPSEHIHIVAGGAVATVNQDLCAACLTCVRQPVLDSRHAVRLWRFR